MSSVVEKRLKTNMRTLLTELRANDNPFIEDVELELNKRKVYTGEKAPVCNVKTGEFMGYKSLYEVREVDDNTFVKEFDREVDSMFELTPTAKRVLAAIRDEYRKSVNVGSGQLLAGNADMIYLRFFDGGLSGRDIEMSEKTFKRGLKEIVAKNILAPYDTNAFWINPTVFFKGDRVRLVKEWRIKKDKKAREEEQQELPLS